MIFDSKFLIRAGRLSNRIINNKFFDVMKYAKKYDNELRCENLIMEYTSKAYEGVKVK